MRLLGIRVEGEYLAVEFSDDGNKSSITLEVPVGWDGWDRETKVSWVSGQITTRLASYTYVGVLGSIYPDKKVMDDAKIDFDALPGWASWTAQQASDWIEVNVTDLESAKTVLANMAKAIVYLRNIVIER